METNQKANTIELSEDFSVPVEALFKAWTDPEQLKQWWRPMNDSLENVKNELQEGGAVEYNFTSKDFRVSGNYKLAEVNKKLVYTWNWEFTKDLENENYELTIEFESKENGSTIHVLQEGLGGEDVVSTHEQAWKEGLQSLKAYLEKSPEPNRDNLKSDEGMSDRSGGYNEAPEQVKVGGG